MSGITTMPAPNIALQAIQQRIKQLSPQIIWQYAAVFFGVIVATLALVALKPYIGDTKLSLIYLLIILICAALAHPSVTFFCGLWSFLCYDFFLVPPYFYFRFELPNLALDPLA